MVWILGCYCEHWSPLNSKEKQKLLEMMVSNFSERHIAQLFCVDQMYSLTLWFELLTDTDTFVVIYLIQLLVNRPIQCISMYSGSDCLMPLRRQLQCSLTTLRRPAWGQSTPFSPFPSFPFTSPSFALFYFFPFLFWFTLTIFFFCPFLPFLPE